MGKLSQVILSLLVVATLAGAPALALCAPVAGAGCCCTKAGCAPDAAKARGATCCKSGDAQPAGPIEATRLTHPDAGPSLVARSADTTVVGVDGAPASVRDASRSVSGSQVSLYTLHASFLI